MKLKRLSEIYFLRIGTITEISRAIDDIYVTRNILRRPTRHKLDINPASIRQPTY